MLTSGEGGEQDPQTRRTEGEKDEPERSRRAAQQLQGDDRRPGQEHDRCPDGVHQGLRHEEFPGPHRIEGAAPMKRAALYMRVSTADQNPQTQLLDLRTM